VRGLRIRALLLLLGLAGCGIYGPPERPAAPAAQPAVADEPCEDGEQAQ
jgi:predicted small lipoprotein YifL